jgi:hypothetical protein
MSLAKRILFALRQCDFDSSPERSAEMFAGLLIPAAGRRLLFDGTSFPPTLVLAAPFL